MIPHVLRDRRGSSAAEFAMVLPLLIIFLIGIIDVGRLMWTWNHAEKATQVGARFAVVTDPVPTGLASHSFVGTESLTQGDIIPSTAYGTMSCHADAAGNVTCDPCEKCPWGTAADSGNDSPFMRIYDRMHAFMPDLNPDNVRILYKPSGLGFAGNPNGADASPLITVELTGMAFQPTLFQLFGGEIDLPDFSTALTMESGQTYSDQVPN
ncbi:TadE family protein [Sphingobium sp. MI1205]|nr:TadE family protein [Sphingobium sp. MI1205]